MAIRHKKAVLAEEVRAFGGLDASSPNGDGGIACDMKNFKVLPDGSLIKREGFSVLATLGDAVRGMTVLHEAAGDFILAVAGASLYRISAADGGYEQAEVFTTVSGQAVFFPYDGELYIMDGAEIYRYAGGVSVSECIGYIPLYGDGWNLYDNFHQINEPINLFSKKIRVRYNVREALEDFYLNPYIDIASVDTILINGKEFVSYDVDADLHVRFDHAYYIYDMEVCMTLEDSYWHDAVIRSARQVTLYDSFSAGRIFLYGADKGGALYVSLPVSEQALSEARIHDERATSLYFPKDREACFDNGQTVTAVGRMGDRMMICTADGAWVTENMTELESVTADRFPLRALSQAIGCSAGGGMAFIGGDVPVTLSAGGIYCWNVDPDMEYRCTAVRISDGIAPLVDGDFFARATVYYQRLSDELWFFVPGDGAGRVFIYNCAQKLWYCYEGVKATRIFDVGSRVGFYSGADIFTFDSARFSDLYPYGEREIVGYFRSRRMAFGNPETRKRAVRLYLEADAADGEITVGLHDGALLSEVAFAEGVANQNGYCSRVNTPGFHRLTVTLRADGAGRQRIFGYCIHRTESAC